MEGIIDNVDCFNINKQPVKPTIRYGTFEITLKKFGMPNSVL